MHDALTLLVLKLWISTSGRGLRDYWSAAPSGGMWRLPTTRELLDMVKDRGDKTVKKYLIDAAGMASTLADVDEFGPVASCGPRPSLTPAG